MTPVIATYNQSGKVILAIFLCSLNFLNFALIRVINTKGIITIDKTISHRSLYEEPSIINTPGVQNVSISATSVSDITGIPRATCIRKLNLMAKQKIVSQDKNSKRYYIIPEAFNKNLVSKDLTEEASTIYSEFYYISIKALSSKNLH